MYKFPGRQDPDHHRLGAEGARGGHERDRGAGRALRHGQRLHRRAREPDPARRRGAEVPRSEPRLRGALLDRAVRRQRRGQRLREPALHRLQPEWVYRPSSSSRALARRPAAAATPSGARGWSTPRTTTNSTSATSTSTATSRRRATPAGRCFAAPTGSGSRAASSRRGTARRRAAAASARSRPAPRASSPSPSRSSTAPPSPSPPPTIAAAVCGTSTRRAATAIRCAAPRNRPSGPRRSRATARARPGSSTPARDSRRTTFTATRSSTILAPQDQVTVTTEIDAQTFTGARESRAFGRGKMSIAYSTTPQFATARHTSEVRRMSVQCCYSDTDPTCYSSAYVAEHERVVCHGARCGTTFRSRRASKEARTGTLAVAGRSATDWSTTSCRPTTSTSEAAITPAKGNSGPVFVDGGSTYLFVATGRDDNGSHGIRSLTARCTGW